MSARTVYVRPGSARTVEDAWSYGSNASGEPVPTFDVMLCTLYMSEPAPVTSRRT